MPEALSPFVIVKTKDLPGKVREADIVVVGVGIPQDGQG